MNIRKALTISTATIALLGSVAVASAADLAPAPVEPAAPVYYAYNWTGFYVGANIGGGFPASGDRVGLYGPGFVDNNVGNLDVGGFFGGVQAGYNYQWGNFVVGLEGDIQWSGVNDDSNGSALGITAHSKSDVNWFGTVRPRVGYAWDRALIYATGGLAFGGVDYRVNLAGVPGRVDDDSTQVGYAVGGGIEYAFTDNLSAKVEYQYINLGSQTVRGTIAGAPFHTEESTDFHTVRAGINYKF